MAVLTRVSLEEADRIARAHGLGAARRIVPVLAGSVNTNFVVETEARTIFLRVYEEQGPDGVLFEHALLAHLLAAGLPVPRPIAGPPTGVLTVQGKPIALFEMAPGTEICQASVTPARARVVGAVLARAHRAAASFPQRRVGRFGLDRIAERLRLIEDRGREDLRAATARLARTIEGIARAMPAGLPTGVVHGDLFRDNVRWEGNAVVCVLDWESAGEGALVFDLAVALLAWCFDDAMRWDLARALVAGYASERPLETIEVESLAIVARAACVRFATTRITDYELRVAEGAAIVYKDYRRFLARLDAIEAESARSLAARLGLG
jgi:homoserine kinase type II